MEYALRWHDQSPDERDRYPLEDSAIATTLAAAYIGNERIAYVKASFTTTKIADDLFPTTLHWLRKTQGRCGIEFNKGIQHLWLSAHHGTQERPASANKNPWQLLESDAPSDDICAQDLAILEAKYERRYRYWVEGLSVPFVAFSRTEEEYQRRGLATSLYIMTAKRLAQRDMVLRASTVQSASAEALWAHFEVSGLPVTDVEINRNDETTTRRCLDYRGER